MTHPSKATQKTTDITGDIFLCACGQMVSTDDVVLTLHKSRTLTVHILRCAECSTQSLCKANIYGLHSEIYTEEDEYYDHRVVDWGETPHATNYRFLYKVHSYPPNSHQYGYCSACGQPFHWNSDLMRWEDYPNARPTGVL